MMHMHVFLRCPMLSVAYSIDTHTVLAEASELARGSVLDQFYVDHDVSAAFTV